MIPTPGIFARTVVLSFETSASKTINVADTSASDDRVECICLIIDDGEEIVEANFDDPDESALLGEFWQTLKPRDTIVAPNIDPRLAFLRQRSWDLDVIPARDIDIRSVYSPNLIDTTMLWSRSERAESLSSEDLGALLGLRRKTETNAFLDPSEGIASRCQDEARALYEVLSKLSLSTVPERYYEATLFPLGSNQEVIVHSRE